MKGNKVLESFSDSKPFRNFKRKNKWKFQKDLIFDYYIPNPISGIPDNIEEIKDAEKKRCILKENYPVYRGERSRKMKIKVEESIRLEDGKHDGEIEDIKYKTTPEGYEYTDVVLKTKHKDKDISVKAGYPSNITENSALGELLERFGAKLEIGKELEPEEFLTKGKKVVFLTTTKGKYYNVVLESLKPA